MFVYFSASRGRRCGVLNPTTYGVEKKNLQFFVSLLNLRFKCEIPFSVMTTVQTVGGEKNIDKKPPTAASVSLSLRHS